MQIQTIILLQNNLLPFKHRLAFFCLLFACWTGDAGTFDQEWKRRTRQPTNTLRDRRQANLRALGGTGI